MCADGEGTHRPTATSCGYGAPLDEDGDPGPTHTASRARSRARDAVLGPHGSTTRRGELRGTPDPGPAEDRDRRRPSDTSPPSADRTPN